MSLYDTFRAVSAQLFVAMAAPATITSTGDRTINRITGVVTMAGDTTTDALAALGKRRLKADDGTITIQSVARCNRAARAGDQLTIGSKTFVVADVEEVAPDGGEPMVYVLVLR